MGEQDTSKEKRSAFIEEKDSEKTNRILRKDALVDKDKIRGDHKEWASDDRLDCTQNIIKCQDFQYDSKPFIVGGAVDPKMTEPEVEVIKDAEGNVMKIKVKCVCGREVDIDCVY